MEYESTMKAAYANQAAAFAGSGQTNAIAAPPRTIATAVSGLDSLNGRLADMRALAGKLCESIGGPFPANGISKDRPPSCGAVGRMNDSVDSAHSTLSEIEGLLSSIVRALG